MYLRIILFAIVIGAPAYMIYRDETRPEDVKEALLQQRKTDLIRTLDVRCVKGVEYYFTDGAHNVRFAPVVDAETLTYKRCQ